jgi:glucokinase
VAEAARAGDALALRLLENEARWLGMGFAGLLHAYSPDAIVMGGGVAQAFDLLEPVLRATLRERALPAFREVPVLRAALGEDSGLVGAAALALDTLTAPFPAGE